jgi:AraC-like DNA-binding protein
MSISTPKTPEPRYFSKNVSEARRFYLRLKPGKSQKLRVVSGGREHCGKDYQIDRTGFAFLTVEFVLAGAGVVSLQGKSHELKPGTVLVYGRGMPHRISSDPVHPMTKYFLAFEGQEARELLAEAKLPPGSVAQVKHPEQIQQLLEELIDFGLGDHANRDRLCATSLQYLIMKLGVLSVPFGFVQTPSMATYERCRRYIEENFLSISSLQSVADACHVDLAYLCRLFQRFGRESPSQYLQHLRMNRAVDLLQNSNRLIKEVAQEIGFSDPYNFSRAFKRVFGLSPAFLRK